MRNPCWEMNWEHKRRSKLIFLKWEFKSQIYWLKTTVGQDENICFNQSLNEMKVLLFIPNPYLLSSLEIFWRMLQTVFHARKHTVCRKGTKKVEKGPKKNISYVIFLSLLKQYNIFIQGTDQNLTCKNILACLWQVHS